jgi:twinkle protein
MKGLNMSFSIQDDITLCLKSLGNYKQRRDEYHIEICPFCGSSRDDKYTFHINANEGVYKCHRGSCNETGNMYQLKQALGLLTVRKEYKPIPVVIPKNLTKTTYEYLKSRGFSDETMKYCRVTQDSNRHIVFNYFLKENLVAQKIRHIENKREMRITGKMGRSMPFWLWEKVKLDKPLIITEGEYDAMALVEANLTNVVSLPSGAGSSGKVVSKHFDDLEKIPEFILWMDADEAGQKALQVLINKLGVHKCKVVKPEYGKDANECLLSNARTGITNAIKNAYRPHVENFVCSTQITPVSFTQTERIKTLLPNMDEFIKGGLPTKFYTVIAGKRGDGKTSLVNNLIVNCIRQDLNVFYYSGEMDSGDVMSQIFNIFAGRENIKYNGEEYIAKNCIREEFIKNYQDKLIINDNVLDTEIKYTDKDILGVLEQAIKRYDLKLIVLDNLMKIRIRGCRGLSEKLDRMDDLCDELVTLSKKYSVHFVLVQHPTKVAEKKIHIDDIRGSGRLMDAASNVILMHRVDDDFKAHNKGFENIIDKNCLIEMVKNRYGGKNFKLFVNYDPETSRFYDNAAEIQKTYPELYLEPLPF